MAFIVATKPTPAFSIGGPGPVSGGGTGSTDNAVARWDGATGLQIQNSGVIIDDSNNVTGISSLTVTTLIATSTITTGDNMIVLNDDVVGAPTEDAGIEVNRGSSTAARLMWNETTDKWTAGVTGSLDSLATSASSSSTDNTLPRFDGTSGIKIQTSSIVVDDSNNLSGAASLTATGDVSGVSHTFSGTGGGKLTTQLYASVPQLMIGDVNNAGSNSSLILGSYFLQVSRWGSGTNFDIYNKISTTGIEVAANSSFNWHPGFVAVGTATARMRYGGTNRVSFDSGNLGSATLHGPLATGSNSAANDLILGSGVSTGNATPGKLRLRSTIAGSSGSTEQTLTDTMVLNGLNVELNSATLLKFGTGAADVNLSLFGGNLAVSTNAGAWGNISAANGVFAGNVNATGQLTITGASNLNGAITATTSISVGTTATFTGAATFNNEIKPASLADAAATNNSIYYSTDAAKLVYKDGAGVVNALY